MDTVAEIRRHLDTVLAGQYQLREVLGRGGMGTVFLADDLKLERAVAIKVLPPQLAVEERFVARFVREARTAARLDHPNIIPIYSVHDDPVTPFFVMKYVAGRSLQDVIAGERLPIPQCQRILVEAAAALAHAHAKGVVHRDVKPSNIMLDETGHVLLGDFGISKALEGNTALTGTGQLVGTPAYMSPEQVTGEKLDGRSDQYSLAVVGHQLLTGRTLFEVGTPNAALFNHVNQTPRSSRELRPDVPEPLAVALLKALAKDPGDRFTSMQAFAMAVWPEHVSLVGPAAGLPRFDQPRRWNRAFGIAAAAAVVAVVVVAIAQWHDPPAAPAGPAVVSQSSIANKATGDSATTPSKSSPAPRSKTPLRAPRNTVATAPAPAVGHITIDATPYGKLSIDSVDVGDTPVVLRALAPGPHVFHVTRDGYKPWSETIVITAGNTERRRITLVPQQP